MISFVPDLNNAYAKAAYGKNAVAYLVPGCEEHTRCVFAVDGLQTELFEIGDGDTAPVIAEGLIRSALNYAAGRGAFTALVNPAKLCAQTVDVLQKLGFEAENGVLTADIPFVLTCGCHCQKEE